MRPEKINENTIKTCGTHVFEYFLFDILNFGCVEIVDMAIKQMFFFCQTMFFFLNLGILITCEPGNTGKRTILIVCEPGNTGKRTILITWDPGNTGK